MKNHDRAINAKVPNVESMSTKKRTPKTTIPVHPIFPLHPSSPSIGPIIYLRMIFSLSALSTSSTVAKATTSRPQAGHVSRSDLKSARRYRRWHPGHSNASVVFMSFRSNMFLPVAICRTMLGIPIYLTGRCERVSGCWCRRPRPLRRSSRTPSPAADGRDQVVQPVPYW